MNISRINFQPQSSIHPSLLTFLGAITVSPFRREKHVSVSLSSMLVVMLVMLVFLHTNIYNKCIILWIYYIIVNSVSLNVNAHEFSLSHVTLLELTRHEQHGVSQDRSVSVSGWIFSYCARYLDSSELKCDR